MTHDGHRQRMYQKLKDGGVFEDHELLEMLLYNAYPRKNTNPVAHALMDAFRSLKGVLEADFDSLKEVEGVGETVAAYIKCVAACVAPAYSIEGEEVVLNNYGDFKTFATKRLRNKTVEVMELYLLEKSGRVKYIYSETSDDKHRVLPDTTKIAQIITAEKPHGMVIAHNHLTGGSYPSPQDDAFTGEIQVMCSINNIRLHDHCIYAADNDVYSYYDTGKIDIIRAKYNVKSIVKK